MQRLIVSLAAFAWIVALLGAAATAHGAPVTYVSGTAGSNTAPCSMTAPCRQIDYALNQTDPYGTVHVLAGSYSSFTVTSPVDIVAVPGAATVISGSTAQVITIDANRVRIKGLTIDGFSGVIVNHAASVILSVEDCSILFGASPSAIGFDFRPTAGLSTLSLIRTNFIRSTFTPASNAVNIRPTGAASVVAVLDDLHIDRAPSGIVIDGRLTTGSNAVTIRNSTISGSDSFGLATYESGSGTSTVTIEGSNISNNTASFAVGMSGAGATARLLNTTVTGNARGLLAAASSSIISHGGNVIAGNTINGAFTATVPPQ
jgi:hypothetical protein